MGLNFQDYLNYYRQEALIHKANLPMARDLVKILHEKMALYANTTVGDLEADLIIMQIFLKGVEAGRNDTERDGYGISETAHR